MTKIGIALVRGLAFYPPMRVGLVSQKLKGCRWQALGWVMKYQIN